jgi:hypothetical protein
MPSFSAKVNYFLGEKERTQQDETLIEILLKAGDPLAIFHLVKNGQELHQPLPLFKKCKDKHFVFEIWGGIDGGNRHF